MGESFEGAGEAQHLVDSQTGQQRGHRRHLGGRQRQADLDLTVVRRADQHAVAQMHHGVADLHSGVAHLAQSLGQPLTTHRVGEGHRPVADLGRLFVASLRRQRRQPGLQRGNDQLG